MKQYTVQQLSFFYAICDPFGGNGDSVSMFISPAIQADRQAELVPWGRKALACAIPQGVKQYLLYNPPPRRLPPRIT